MMCDLFAMRMEHPPWLHPLPLRKGEVLLKIC